MVKKNNIIDTDPLFIDIGGTHKKSKRGYTTVNISDSNIIHDLDIFPYPFKESSVDAISMTHVLEHLKEPKKVMKELWRISKNNSIIHIKIPYHALWSSQTNPEHLHEFRPLWFYSWDDRSTHCKGIYGGGMSHFKKEILRVIKLKVHRQILRFFRGMETEVYLKVVK